MIRYGFIYKWIPVLLLASKPAWWKQTHKTLHTYCITPLFEILFWGFFCFCFLLLDLTSQGTNRITQFVTLMWVWFPLFSSGFGLLKIWFWGARGSFESTMGWTFGVSQDERKLWVRIVKLKENNSKLELFCFLFCLWFVNFVLIVKQICVPLSCINKNDLLILLCIKSV
jgi:hypothetical protein